MAFSKGGRANVVPIYNDFKVVSCEEVSTPAGKFPAFKILVVESLADSSLTPTTTSILGGEHYLWYAPQVKNFVKQEYDHVPLGATPRILTAELVSFEVK